MTDVLDKEAECWDRVLDVREVSRFLKISESIVRRLIKERRIPFFQVESRYLFYRPAVEAWIRHRMVEPIRSSPKVTEELATAIWNKGRGT
jgi:excisionase family DNA binding protein